MHIRRSLLTGASRVKVKVGETVSPGNILAEGIKPSGFRTINLAEELGVGAADVPKYLQRQIGNTIFKDELLAYKSGMIGFGHKVIVSPADGVLEDLDQKTGILRMRLSPKSVKLACGVWGVVDDINQNEGVVIIRTEATVINGVLGSGKEREGSMYVCGSPEVLISSRQIDASMKGQILIGGEMVFSDGLEKAMEVGLAGLISGGINAHDYRAISGNWNILNPRWSDIGLSIVISEGFGSVPLGEDIFEILKDRQGKFAIIDGNSKRLLIPSDSEQSLERIQATQLPKNSFLGSNNLKFLIPLQAGEKIRVIFGPKFGTIGIIKLIDTSPTRLASGLVTTMVTIEAKNGKLRLPYQNIEAIE
jgi:hypothetical protein